MVQFLLIYKFREFRMNKLLLALLSASMTPAVMCNEAVEADKEKVVVEAVVTKSKCSGCTCTTPTADKSAKAECPCEEAGNVCACPQMAETAPTDAQDVKN